MINYFAIAFTCVYLVLTVGVAKTTHYCMGRLNHTNLFTFEAKKCRCAVYLKAPLTCCKDTHELITIDDDQSQGATTTPNAPEFFELGILHPTSVVDQPPLLGHCDHPFYTDTSPPNKEPIFVMNCSLVFYA